MFRRGSFEMIAWPAPVSARSGSASFGSASLGSAGAASPGALRPGRLRSVIARHGKVSQAAHGSARSGSARLDTARSLTAGSVRLGGAPLGPAGIGMPTFGSAGVVWFGAAWQGTARRGAALSLADAFGSAGYVGSAPVRLVCARSGQVCLGAVRQAWHGIARFRTPAFGSFWLGPAGLVWLGCGALRWSAVRHDKATCGRSGTARQRTAARPLARHRSIRLGSAGMASRAPVPRRWVRRDMVWQATHGSPGSGSARLGAVLRRQGRARQVRCGMARRRAFAQRSVGQGVVRQAGRCGAGRGLASHCAAGAGSFR